MKNTKSPLPEPAQRSTILSALRSTKMTRSAHAYVRGSTVKFYEWLETSNTGKIPDGPAIWICGDCHLGNLGPIADANGRIDFQIRDFDQTVIGNPVHDLIRLGLSLATAARGSDLPGITTAKMMEQLIEGYAQEFCDDIENKEPIAQPKCIRIVMKKAASRTWDQLAKERIEDTKPSIPLGNHFWPISADESKALHAIFQQSMAVPLASTFSSQVGDATLSLLDAAYWVKGCSSLGKLRFAALLDVREDKSKKKNLALIDIKEAMSTTAPRAAGAKIPRENGKRVLEGALHLSPYLGERMLASRVLDRPVFIRELLPQDIKLEIKQLTQIEAMKVAKYLAAIVGKAHARQMDGSTRAAWRKNILGDYSKKLDAPSWLWNSVVELMATHEAAYLEHCRIYAMRMTS